MENQLTPQQSFQKQISDRLREDVGKLIPDEALAEMVDRAVKDMFFTKFETTKGYRTMESPSWFESEVAKVLGATIKQHMDAYFAKNGDAIQEQILQAVTTSMPSLIASMVNGAVYGAGTNAGHSAGISFQDAIHRAMNL